MAPLRWMESEEQTNELTNSLHGLWNPEVKCSIQKCSSKTLSWAESTQFLVPLNYSKENPGRKIKLQQVNKAGKFILRKAVLQTLIYRKTRPRKVNFSEIKFQNDKRSSDIPF